MADIHSVDFNMSDGFTPHQINKLNTNFRNSIGKLNSVSSMVDELMNRVNSNLVILSNTITTDYNDLINKPQIEGVTLESDKDYEQLNLNKLTNTEIENLLT